MALSEMYDSNGNQIWMEERLGSSHVERPVGLIPSKETKEVCEAIFMHLEKGNIILGEKPLPVTFEVDGKDESLTFNFSCKTSQVRVTL